MNVSWEARIGPPLSTSRRTLPKWIPFAKITSKMPGSGPSAAASASAAAAASTDSAAAISSAISTPADPPQGQWMPMVQTPKRMIQLLPATMKVASYSCLCFFFSNLMDHCSAKTKSITTGLGQLMIGGVDFESRTFFYPCHDSICMSRPPSHWQNTDQKEI